MPDENPKDHPGHQATLRLLRQREEDEPLLRTQVAGGIVFDLFYRLLLGDGERGVRIDDLIAALSSIGGHLCLAAVLDELRRQGRTPQEIGMVEVTGSDGERYFFGDAPNRLLLESELSLLSLVLGAAHELGAAVSLDMVHEVMRRTAQRVGTPEFGEVEVPEDHRPALSPFDWVRHGRERMVEALDLYDVPPESRPTAVGFALQRAVDEGRQALDPLMAAKIAVECAVPMAKVDPLRFR